MTTRTELGWALKAVLPHCGSQVKQLDMVGISRSYVYATDGYTAGIARCDSTGVARLTSRDASDLQRWVRPTTKKTEDQPVVLKVTDTELHVGLLDADDQLVDSTVYELDTRRPELEDEIVGWIRQTEHLIAGGDLLAYKPDLFARFDKARREETDRLRLYPKCTDRLGGVLVGVGLVTVGDDFLGLIHGLTDDGVGCGDHPVLKTILTATGRAA